MSRPVHKAAQPLLPYTRPYTSVDGVPFGAPFMDRGKVPQCPETGTKFSRRISFTSVSITLGRYTTILAGSQSDRNGLLKTESTPSKDRCQDVQFGILLFIYNTFLVEGISLLGTALFVLQGFMFSMYGVLIKRWSVDAVLGTAVISMVSCAPALYFLSTLDMGFAAASMN